MSARLEFFRWRPGVYVAGAISPLPTREARVAALLIWLEHLDGEEQRPLADLYAHAPDIDRGEIRKGKSELAARLDHRALRGYADLARTESDLGQLLQLVREEDDKSLRAELSGFPAGSSSRFLSLPPPSGDLRREAWARGLVALVDDLFRRFGVSTELPVPAKQDDINTLDVVRTEEWHPANATAQLAVSNAVAELSLSAGIERAVARRLERHLVSTDRLRLRDLVDGPGLYVEPRWSAVGGPGAAGDLLADLAARLPTKGVVERANAALLTGDGGMGKSLTVDLLFARTAEQAWTRWQVCVVLVDLRDYLGDVFQPNFGDYAWLASHLAIDIGAPRDPAWIENAVLRNRLVTLVDGLDEFATTLSPSELRRLLSVPTMRSARVVTVRSSFYERALRGTDLLGSFDVLTLEPWPEKLQHQLIDAQSAATSHTATASQVISWRRDHPARQEFLATPLYLSMLTELAVHEPSALAKVGDALSLLNVFSSWMLQHEAMKGGSHLDVDEKSALLEDLAWSTYNEAAIESDADLEFSRNDLRASIRSRRPEAPQNWVERAVYDLESRSVLEQRLAPPGSFETLVLRFRHKRFHDFFMARRLFHDLRSESPHLLAEHFGLFLSADVSEVLLVMLGQARGNPRRCDEFAERLQQALEVADARSSGGRDAIERARGRIAAQQLSYYLGSLGSPTGFDYLSERVKSEPDPWLRRGMRIGLALSGESRFLDIHLEELKSEASAGGGPYYDTNIGFTLTFFGDQSLSVLAPDTDAGGASCRRTVRGLITFLYTAEKNGSWRSSLFTLIELAKRKRSLAEFSGALTHEFDRASEILARMEADPLRARWDEVAEISRLLPEYAPTVSG